MLAPIALFTYNRPDHLKLTLEALIGNSLARDSLLFVFSDGPKGDLNVNNVIQIREMIKNIKGFKSIETVERKQNIGLANSIISGVTQIVNEFGKVIVLEDDLVTSPYFLEFMNEALEIYKTDERVISIHGYIYPVKQELPSAFFLKGADCWGWATWKRGWDLFEPNGNLLLKKLQQLKLTKRFDFDGCYNFTKMLKKQIAGQNDSWAVRWYASAFLANKYTLYPGKSLIKNIGHDGKGTHSRSTKLLDCEIVTDKIVLQNMEVEECEIARMAVKVFLRKLKYDIVKKIWWRIQKLRVGLMQHWGKAR